MSKTNLKLPTLDEFLNSKGWPPNQYVRFPGFRNLYVRRSDIYVYLENKMYRCTKVVQLANIEAVKPGNGAFGKLVDHLLAQGYAVYVELAHELRFQQHLLKMGFAQCNQGTGPHFIKGHEGHLQLKEKN